ncbi:MAG: amidohydrolase family protein, partial [Trueperaceae bacterium]
MSDLPPLRAFDDPSYDPLRDRILRGAVVRTLDADRPSADAVALRGGRVLAVGSEAEVRSRVASDAETIDLDGLTVLPGFHDAHVHLASHGREGLQVRLEGTTRFTELVNRVRDRAAHEEDGAWLLGSGFAEQRWPSAPDRAELDAAVPDRPVLLRSQDHHSAIANGEALRRAGIDATTSDPNDGRIERRADGTPTGVLRERAVDLLLRAVPTPGPEGLHEALLHGARRLSMLGVTTAHHMAYESAAEMRAVADAASSDAFPLRTWACLPHEELDAARALGIATGQGGDRFTIGGAKFFVDGALGSLTAWMLEPYLDSSDAGMRVIELDALHERVGIAIATGLTPVTHAIGDAAVRAVLNVYEA